MRGALGCSKRLRGYIEGDEGYGIVLAQGLVSSPLQITLQARLGACYVGSLIGDFRPTESPFRFEAGAKVHYSSNGTLLFSLLKQLRRVWCLLLIRSLSSAYLGGAEGC